MAGAVYCPLSPRDPEQRLRALVEQTQSRFVLVHWMTRDKFKDDDFVFDINGAINTDKVVNDDDLERMSSVTVTSDSIAYVIFTSGSTGTPKAVSIQRYF
jgi:fengycin family lipopeptide synthetase D